MVVESATKAKVIQGYLGDMFEVLPSYGHVRELPSKSGSVRPDNDFSMVWEVPSAASTHLKCIKVALSGYDIFFLFNTLSKDSKRFVCLLKYFESMHLCSYVKQYALVALLGACQMHSTILF